MFNDSKQVQDVSQQTENTKEKTKKEIEVVQEERRRRRGASGQGVCQNPSGETTTRCSEACTLCSKQVTLDPRYETQLEPTDLDYDYDTGFMDVCYTQVDSTTERWDS
ncbi:hypothetical protein KPH14_011412 [Odynerus spinipes]|uniref:Uncharacterized protein n=1 Tax=Odynerus spinipes TaxID=1348599 RepID=A0AAD9VUI4_9HYME|nr:hypothetical protein KPH14_011412 [Odynerus spinipes]